jgi:hypothetical protein
MKIVSLPRAKEILRRGGDIDSAHKAIADQFRSALAQGGQVAAAVVSNENPATSPLLLRSRNE